jgi:SAM-dependent methyltransferase
MSDPMCPACGASRSARLWTVNAAEAAQHFVLREADAKRHGELSRHIETLWHGSSCDLMECGACGLCFAWPYVAGDGLFYNLAYPRVAYPTQRWEFDRTLPALPSIRADARALEIGSGFGHFLDLVSPRLFARRAVTAVEYNSDARAVIERKGFRAIGVDIRNGAFPPDAGPFDFVFMFQVLEHMAGLDDVFARLRELTTPHADIFIAVPNPKRIAFNERFGGLMDMPPNHIARWTVAAFAAIAGRHAFEIAETAQEDCSSLFRLAMQYAKQRHQRVAQVPGSLSNRVRKQSGSLPWRVVEYAAAIPLIPSMLPALIAATVDRRELGESLWAHLRKA